MTVAQKHAWFNLIVIGLTLAVVVALALIRGWPRALGGFGFLGFLGFGPLLYRRSRPGVLWDERDTMIRHRSLLVAYSLFWVVLVATCVSLPAFYGAAGSVPVAVVQWSLFVGMILIVGVTSVVTLAHYGLAGGTHAS